MEEKIKKLLCLLKAEYALFWVLNVALVVLYETDTLPQGTFVGDAQMDYIMQASGILLALCMIPLSLRMFHLSLVKYVRKLSISEALTSYRRWSEVRMAMLVVPSLFNMTAYYTTMNTTGLLCAGMVMLASLFCVPGYRRMVEELDLQKNDTSNIESHEN